MPARSIRCCLALLLSLTLLACVDTKADPGYCLNCHQGTDAGHAPDSSAKDAAQHADAQAMKDAAADSGKLTVDAAVDSGQPAHDATTPTPDAGPCAQTCSGNKPVCDGDLHQCVQCTSGHTEACTGDTDQCDLTNRKCVHCLTHAQCTTTAAPQCDSSAHSCVPCTSDDACKDRAGTKVCDTDNASATKGQCVPCNVKADCSNGQVCNATHQCVQCTQNSDCPADNPQCDTGHNTCGKCTPDATGDAACASRPGTTVCDHSSDATYGGTCVPCTGTNYANCKSGGTQYVCDSAARTCTTDKVEGSALACDACVSDAQCASGPGMRGARLRRRLGRPLLFLQSGGVLRRLRRRGTASPPPAPTAKPRA